MIIKHATWEKRNLGVDCNEITIENSDEKKLLQLEKAIKENTLEYTVVKVPAGLVQVMFMLEDIGFRFIESIIVLTHDFSNFETNSPDTIIRLAKHYSLRKASVIEHERVYDEIRRNIFVTDRIYLDPHFKKELSAERYISWMQDAYSDGMDIYEFMYKKTPVGFVQYKIDKQYCFKATLLGMYVDYDIPAGGVICNYICLREAFLQGAKRVSNVYVSANNPKSLKSMLAVGYQYEETLYVYVKHTEKSYKVQ